MEYIILIAVLVVLIVGVGGTMLFRPRRSRGVSRRNPGADVERRCGTVTDGGSATDTNAPSRPETQAPPSPLIEKPALEKPPPSAGRMVRLRARLARAQRGVRGALRGPVS